MAESLTWHLPDPAATSRLGAVLARALAGMAPTCLILFFEGELGAGKTSLIRAILTGLGHRGRVPSPTYTLVEPYLLDCYRVMHVDLYRLRDPAELDDLGLADELGADDAEGRGSLLLAEWPARGEGRLPDPDLVLHLAVRGDGRQAGLRACTGAGLRLLDEVRRALPAGC